ncbi:hypothetical protein [Wenzhouxiangella sediminis]|jgi:hypothetical protein|uniref:DnrO protein n=1 Tax=Wenzhouxiangella sediminis TaxID=1792836 RepID=A0A3E1KD78_9GAMM|nr:hypothetical protein [Wenzhouxiangella sediminis]RFF33022.1 hypothetical protein DZC52_00220 [Wenzhouxiangella sediminis]
MKHGTNVLLAVLITLGLSGVAGAQQGKHEQGHHEMHASGELQLQRPESGKWASDESLRQGMSELEAAFGPAHAAYRNDAFDAEQAAGLADTIEQKVNFMFANCRLPADADAELHKLLAASLDAARMLRESDEPHRGLHRLHRVLQAYPEHFEHPGWAD